MIKKQFQGMSPHRYSREPLERRFAEEWQDQNYNPHGPGLVRGTLAYLMDKNNKGYPQPPLSERDWLVANTVVQWLGSHVGQCFLAEVLSSDEAKQFRERLERMLEEKRTKPSRVLGR